MIDVAATSPTMGVGVDWRSRAGVMSVGMGMVFVTWTGISPIVVGALLTIGMVLIGWGGWQVTVERAWCGGAVLGWIWIMGALVLVGAMLAALVGRGALALASATPLVLSVLIATLVVAVVAVSVEDWLRLARWFVVGALVSASAALANPGSFGLGRSMGLASHPNHLGLASLLAIMLAVPLFRSARAADWALAALSVPILFAALVASGSRAALLGAATFVAALVIISCDQNARRRVAVLLAAAGVASIVVVRLVIGAGPLAVSRSFAPSAVEAGSNAERWRLYRHTWNMFLDSPLLGHGPSALLTAHSVPLQLIAASGVFGFLAIAIAVRRCVLALQVAERPSSNVLTRAGAAGLVGTFVALVVSNQLYDRYLLVAVALMSVAVGANTAKPPELDRPTAASLTSIE